MPSPTSTPLMAPIPSAAMGPCSVLTRWAASPISGPATTAAAPQKTISDLPEAKPRTLAPSMYPISSATSARQPNETAVRPSTANSASVNATSAQDPAEFASEPSSSGSHSCAYAVRNPSDRPAMPTSTRPGAVRPVRPEDTGRDEMASVRFTLELVRVRTARSYLGHAEDRLLAVVATATPVRR